MFFGYKGFISDLPREMTCRSINVTQVFYCSREDLLSVLKENHEDHEKYCKLRDQYQIISNYVGEQCYACSEYGHTIMNCYKIRFVKRKEFLILKQNYSEEQKRNMHKRSKFKYCTLANVTLTSFEAMKCKLVIIMQLRKQFISNHILENIIIEEHESDKNFTMKYPSIKFQDNQMYLCQFDAHYSDDYTTDSDSLLSQDASSRFSEQNNDSQDLISGKNSSFSSHSSDKDDRKNYKSNQRKSADKNQQQQQFQQQNEEVDQVKEMKQSRYSLSRNQFASELIQAQQPDLESQEQSERITLIAEYNSEQRRRSNNMLAQLELEEKYSGKKDDQLQEQEGIQNINRGQFPHSNNLNQLEREFNVKKQIQSLNYQKQSYLKTSKTEQQEIEIGQSSPGMVMHSQEQKNRIFQLIQQKIKNNNNNSNPISNNNSFSQQSQKSIKKDKNIKKQSTSIPSSNFKRNQFNTYKQISAQLPLPDYKLANIIQMLQYQPKNQSEKSSLTPKLNNQTQKQTQAQQILTGYGQSPQKYNSENKELLIKLQGQVQRYNKFLSQFYKKSSNVGRVKENPMETVSPQQNLAQPSPSPPPVFQKEDSFKLPHMNTNRHQRRNKVNLQEYFNDNPSQYEELQELDNQKELFIYDFDSLKDYSIYFPHNNAQVVCHSYQDYIERKIIQKKSQIANLTASNSKYNPISPNNQNAKQIGKIKKGEQADLA